MARYLTGDWYTDPRGQHMSWQDYERAFEEQERKRLERLARLERSVFAWNNYIRSK